MTARAALALDLGTTGVRALAVGEDGRVLGRAWRPIASRHPQPGWIEQDPAAWWSASEDVLRAALAAAGLAAREVAALGVASQRATAVAWDARRGAPVGPAIVWQDGRTGARVAELVARGIPASTMTSSTKLEWLLAHEPALRAAAAGGRLRLGTPDAWLTDRLTGGAAFATDPSHASCTGLYDFAQDAWHAGALALHGIERDWLPAIVASDAIVGETPAALLGAPVPVAARLGDQQAACFAQGVLDPGGAKLTVGTSAMLDVHTGATPARVRRGAYPLALWRRATSGRAFCLEGTVVTAGAAVEWLVSLGLLARAADLDAVAGSVASSEGVVFVPALQGLGTPHGDPAARAGFFGLTRGSSGAALVRSVVEGVAMRCAELSDALGGDGDAPLRVDGGLARSRLFLALLADLSGRAVLRAAEPETTGLGAALLAGVATGLFRSDGDAVARLGAPERIEPRLDAASRDALRAQWQRAVGRVRER